MQFNPYSDVAYNLIKATWGKKNWFIHKVIIWLLELFCTLITKSVSEKSPSLQKSRQAIATCPTRGPFSLNISLAPIKTLALPFMTDTGPQNPPRLAGVDIWPPTLDMETKGEDWNWLTLLATSHLISFLGFISPLGPDTLSISHPSPTPFLGRLNIRTSINSIFPIVKLYLQCLIMLLHLRK